MNNKLTILVAVLLFVFLLFRINPGHSSDNDLSRLAGIVAIARYNQLNIDNTPQKNVGDRVEYNGKKFSSKPPVLNYILGNIVKYTFKIKSVLLNNDIAIYRVSTAIATVLPLVMTFLLFVYLQRAFMSHTEFEAILYSLFLVLGTLLFSYSRHLTNHVLEAVVQLGIFSLLLLPPKNPRVFGFIIGILLSALLAIDITYGFIIIPATLSYLYLNNREFLMKNIIYIIIGGLPLTFLHFYLNYAQFGTFSLPQLHPDIYLSYPGSKWVGDVKGMESLNDPLLLRLFNYTFGTYGFFLYQPILLLPFFMQKNWKNSIWLYVVAITIGYISFNAILQPNYGGSSFGPRRFLPLIPMLYWFVIIDLKSLWSKSGYKLKLIIILLLFFNLMISFIGYSNTWGNWNYYTGSNRELYFPLLYTIRKVLEL